MKAKIKDESGEINVALRTAINIGSETTELILNIVDYIRESEHDVTLNEIVILIEDVKSLFPNETK